MVKPFTNKVRKGEIVSPVKRGFTEKKWTESFISLGSSDLDDIKLFVAGAAIYKILSEIRLELGKLFKNAPKISNEKLLIAYFSVSNRNRFLLEKTDLEYSSGSKSAYGMKSRNNSSSNEFTLQEIAEGSVDGLNKAIFFAKLRINNNDEISQGEQPLDLSDFIKRESAFSQLYDTYESYWELVLWGDFDFEVLSKERNIYTLTQKDSLFERGAFSSQIRKDRIAGTKGAFSITSEILRYHKNDNYIKITNSKKLVVRKIDQSINDVENGNSIWRTSELYLKDDFPSEYLEGANKLGFTVMEALNVLRNLTLLSIQYQGLFSSDDEILKFNKLSEYCPKIKKNELLRKLTQSTGYSFSKVGEIMRFIEFDTSSNKDLWCHPVILVNNKYILLTSALVTPVIIRVVEKWISFIFKDIDKKGYSYEKTVNDKVNKSLDENRLIIDYDRALSKRIKISSGEEEIDLMFRLGDLIVLGEIKSIVSSDSHISQYRTYSVLERASQQIKRKSKFFEKNIEDVFNNIGWSFDESIDYKFLSCIVNSGRMYVGYEINDIPVTDDVILSKYLNSNNIPCVSDFNPIMSDNVKHLAWYELYDCFEGLKCNFEAYLRRPPQVYFSLDSVEHGEVKIPYINKESCKLIVRRLTYKDIQLKQLLEQDNGIPFELKKSADLEKFLESKSISF